MTEFITGKFYRHIGSREIYRCLSYDYGKKRALFNVDTGEIWSSDHTGWSEDFELVNGDVEIIFHEPQTKLEMISEPPETGEFLEVKTVGPNIVASRFRRTEDGKFELYIGNYWKEYSWSRVTGSKLFGVSEKDGKVSMTVANS